MGNCKTIPFTEDRRFPQDRTELDNVFSFKLNGDKQSLVQEFVSLHSLDVKYAESCAPLREHRASDKRWQTVQVFSVAEDGGGHPALTVFRHFPFSNAFGQRYFEWRPNSSEVPLTTYHRRSKCK